MKIKKALLSAITAVALLITSVLGAAPAVFADDQSFSIWVGYEDHDQDYSMIVYASEMKNICSLSCEITYDTDLFRFSFKTEGSSLTDSLIFIVCNDASGYAVGDVNMDGSITTFDALLALKLAMTDGQNSEVVQLADVTGDGLITSADAMKILQYVTGAIKAF